MAEIKSFPNNQDEYIGAENVMKWMHGRTSGVFSAEGNALVSAVQDTMAVTVADGVGWLSNDAGDGVVWWNDKEKTDNEKLRLQIDVADGVLNRIDRVIVSWPTTSYVDRPTISVLKGTPATYPNPPSITNDLTVRQISLAKIYIAAGTISLTNAMITDERLDPNVCGLVTERVAVDTSGMNQQFISWFETVQGILGEDEAGNLLQLIEGLEESKVPITRKVNRKALSADVELSAADVGARPSTWMPTAADVGAAPTYHYHTNDVINPRAIEIGTQGFIDFHFSGNEDFSTRIGEFESGKLNVSGEFYENGSRVFSAANKPTAADVGALARTFVPAGGAYDANSFFTEGRIEIYGATMTNFPTGIVHCWLDVYYHGSGWYRQICHDVRTTNVWIRSSLGGTWSQWYLLYTGADMMPDVEYLTSERWFGAPVYAKVITFGAMPNNSVKKVAHGIYGFSAANLVDIDFTANGAGLALTYPGGRFNQGLTTVMWVEPSQVAIQTTLDMSDYTATYVIMKYTK